MKNSTVDWKPVGQVRAIGGSLDFPKGAGRVQGIYWFRVSEGDEVVAGYVGQAAGLEGFAQRFGFYRYRGNHPALPLAKKTTSRNARKLLDAIEAGKTVDVSVLDGPELAGRRGKNPYRDDLEEKLIHQLCRSGVEVWNVQHVLPREVILLTVPAPTEADQSARDGSLEGDPGGAAARTGAGDRHATAVQGGA